MTDEKTLKTPTELSLHSKSRRLNIAFGDEKFSLSCEYLRVFATAKEVRTLDKPVIGKEKVNIKGITPRGEYAVCLEFDDGHDTSIYSWDTLYDLCIHQESHWKTYLSRLDALGYERKDPSLNQRKEIQLLFFTYIVKKLGRDAEKVTLPPSVTDVDTLMDWLRRRDPERGHVFAEGSYRVTVNKQFSEGFTLLEDGDEVAIVPNSPHAPVKNDKT